MRTEKADFSIAFMCRQLGVARSGYYAWCRRGESRRAAANRKLLVHIRTAHQLGRGEYGSPRVHRELRAGGHEVGRHRVARLMRQDRLFGRKRRRFVHTTDSAHSHRIAPNTLQRRFKPAAPNRVWAADITYVPTRQGWLYLAVVLDLFSRRVVGWHMSSRLDQQLTLSALEMALISRRPKPGLLHHSDRGVQYASDAYQQLLTSSGALCSMSRKGNCWDNAVVESFFNTLKTGLGHDVDFTDREQATQAIFEYVEIFYNRQRRHSSLDYVSPTEYERLAS